VFRTEFTEMHLVLIVIGIAKTNLAIPYLSATFATSHAGIALVYGLAAFFTPMWATAATAVVIFAFL